MNNVLLAYLTDTAWAMEPTVLQRLTEIVARHSDGVTLEAGAIEKIVAARDENDSEVDGYVVQEGTAIIPIHGVIAKYASQVNGISQPQGTSVEQIGRDLAQALGDSNVEKIVLHIESPGGSINGLADLAQAIAEARDQKPVIAFADDSATSAAYWLGSQASEFYGSRSAVVGSIGVYMVLRDSSKAAAQYGVKYLLVRSGPFKGVGAPGSEIAEGDLADLQGQIDAIYQLFVDDVSRGRAMTRDDVLPLAQGQSLIGEQAVAAGLLDGIKTFDEVLQIETTQVDRDDELNSTALNNPVELQGDSTMVDNKTTPMTAAQIEQIKQEAATAAVASNQTRVTAVTKILAEYPDLIEKAVADTACGEAEATAMLVPKLRAENETLKAASAESQKKLDVIANSGGTAVASDSSDNVEKTPEQKAEAAQGEPGKLVDQYKALVAEKIKAGASKAEAMQAAGNENPKAHEAWIDADNQ